MGDAEAASGLSGPVGGEGPCVLYDSGGTTVVGALSLGFCSSHMAMRFPLQGLPSGL